MTKYRVNLWKAGGGWHVPIQEWKLAHQKRQRGHITTVQWAELEKASGEPAIEQRLQVWEVTLIKARKKSCPARKQEVGRPWGRENSFCLFKEQQAVREPAAEAARKEGSSPPACCAHITLNIVFHSTPRMAALNQDLFFSFRSNPQPDWEITFVWINYLITFITHDFKNCLAFNSRQLPLPLKTD